MTDDTPAQHRDPDLPVEPVADGRGSRSSVRRNVMHLMSSQAISWVLATILAIVIPRMLGDTATGQLRLAFSLWLIAQVVVGLGTSTHLKLSVARDNDRGLAALGSVLIMRAVGFAVVAALFVVYLLLVGAQGQLWLLMLLGGVQASLGSFVDAFSACFYGLERMSVPAFAAVLAKVVGTTVAIAILLSGAEAWTVVAAMVFANGLALAVLVHAFRGVAPLVFAGWYRTIAVVVRASIPFFATGAILTLYLQVDTVVIATLVDEATLGWYAAADSLYGSLLFPATILASTVFPTLGRLHAHEPEALPDLVRRTFSLLLVLGVPIGLGTSVIAGEFAPLLYGEDFREAGAVLAVLGVVLVLTFCTILFGTVALATERQRFWSLLMVGAVLLSIALDVVLVPWTAREFDNGAIGGALAYIVTEAMMLVCGAWKIVPYLFNRASLWRWVRIFAAGAAMVAAAYPVREQFLLVPIAAGAVVYAVAVLAFGVMTDFERGLVGRVLSAAGLRTRWARHSELRWESFDGT